MVRNITGMFLDLNQSLNSQDTMPNMEQIDQIRVSIFDEVRMRNCMRHRRQGF